MPQQHFIHLHIHTEYSIVDGLIRLDPLINSCVEKQFPAVAVTDRCNLFGLVKFYQKATASGIKPIVGTDILIHDINTNRPFLLTLLCQNQTGYNNITKLISKAYVEGQHAGVPMIQKEWLEQMSEGIIALSGGYHGDIGRAILSDNKDLAAELLHYWNELFPQRFYIELTRTGRENEETYNQAILSLLDTIDKPIPVVATNDVRFLNPEDFEAHEARVCIHDGHVLEDSKRPRLYSEQQHLRSAAEMIELFADIPEAIANTVEVAKRCNLHLTLGEVFLPSFPIPDNFKHPTNPDETCRGESVYSPDSRPTHDQEPQNLLDKYFEHEAKKGLETNPHLDSSDPKYQKRLQYEIDVIKQMGFAGYFLIVADFVKWAKDNGVPVGPGRGSGAGSIVAYALGITDLDPIKHELLFERFLNPERVSMPDFDIDFCMEGRDRVIEYVAERYGRESVSQIITFGTMAAKAVVRDVGRVLGHPYGYVDKIAKLIPFELGITLDKALQQEERLAQLYKDEEEVRILIDLAKKLEGLTRNAGKHAGGVVISPSLLTDFAPLYCEEGGSNLVTQFDKNDVESVGLVKFDFLGLRTLTIINWTIKIINARRKLQQEAPLDIGAIPLDDPATFKLLKACSTTAVFQLESRGMKDLIKRLQPDCFDDIVALVALFRPGPLQSGMVDDFIERKHGRAKVAYPHPDLQSILAPTYGVILYQEQVMQIAQILAGYSLGAADLLRRAMGKKKPEEMAKQRAFFMEGATANSVDKHVASGIFDLMEKFAGYGFNKSHSAGYALISYQTAWLKAHYPAEFMAAVLSSDMDNTDKVVGFIAECENLNLTIIPPHINHSAYKFTVNKDNHIVYGLGAIKGVGAAAIESIIAERQEGFSDLFDFCKRVDTRKANKRVLEALISSGAMDGLGPNRATMFASIETALKAADQHARSQSNGQFDMFGASETKTDPSMFDRKPKWPQARLLEAEHTTLGIYLSGHPIDQYQKELSKFVSDQIVNLVPEPGKTVVIAGFINTAKTLITKSGKRMAVLTVTDKTASIDITLFSEVFENSREKIEKGQLVIVEGEISLDTFSGNYRMQAKRVLNLTEARSEFGKALMINLHQKQLDDKVIADLTSILSPYKNGKLPVIIAYACDGASSKLKLGDEWNVTPTDDLLEKLAELVNKENSYVLYLNL